MIFKSKQLLGDKITELAKINMALLNLASKVSDTECIELCEIVQLNTQAMTRILKLVQS